MAASPDETEFKTPNQALKISDQKFLEKDRLGASQVLVQALAKFKTKDEQRMRLVSRLKNISTIFYTDNAQKVFEHGNSLYPEQLDEAAGKYNEALEMEPTNLAVVSALARAEIRGNKNAAAFKRIELGLVQNPFYESLIILKMKALDGLENFESSEATLHEHQGLLGKRNLQVMASQANWCLAKADLKCAEDFVRQMTEVDKNFPDAYYLRWKLDKQQQTVEPQNLISNGQKYVSICKNLSQKVVTKYLESPNLCSRLKEVEDDVESETQKLDAKDSN